MYPNRALFKHKHNPFYKEEYELKESTNAQGNPYSSYVISVSELTAILPDGREVTYNEWEKIQEEPEVKEQSTLSIFPDFEETKEAEKKEDTPWYDNNIEKYLDTIAKQLTRIADKLENK